MRHVSVKEIHSLKYVFECVCHVLIGHCQGAVSGEPPVRHGDDTWPPLSGLVAGGRKLAAVITPSTRALHESQVLLSFHNCAHIVILLRFTGPHTPAPRPLLRTHVTRTCGRPAAGSIRMLSASRSGAHLPHPILYVCAATSAIRENSRFPLSSPPQRVLPGSPADRLFRQSHFRHTASPLRYGVRYPDVGGRVGGTRRPH